MRLTSSLALGSIVLGALSVAAPSPPVMVATVIYDTDAEQFVVTNADEFPDATWAWEDEDGNPIEGQTATTLARAAAPVGKYVRAIANGDPATASNWAIAPVNRTVLDETFDGVPDNTLVDGWNGWNAYVNWSGSAITNEPGAEVIDDSVYLASGSGDSSARWMKSLSGGQHKKITVFNPWNADGSNNNLKSSRGFYLGWKPATRQNHIRFFSLNTGIQSTFTASGSTTSQTNQAGTISVATTSYGFSWDGSVVRTYVNGSETAASVSANGFATTGLSSLDDVTLSFDLPVANFDAGGAPWRMFDRILVEDLPIQFAITDWTIDGASLLIEGTCSSSVTNYDWALADAAGRIWSELASNVAVDGAGAWSLEIDPPYALAGKVAYLAIRPHGSPDNLSILKIGKLPIAEPIIPFADQRPGMNWNFPNSWGSSDIFNNRLYQSRFAWSDAGDISLEYCDDLGFPLSVKEPGKESLKWRLIVFEDCPINRGGAWEIDAPGAVMTPVVTTSVAVTSNTAGHMAFNVTPAEHVIFILDFTTPPTAGFGSISIKPVGAGEGVANPQALQDFGNATAGIRLIRVIRPSNGEGLTKRRPSDQKAIPEQNGVTAGVMAGALEEYDADTLYSFPADVTDTEVLDIVQSWKSVASPTRRFYHQLGNETFWNENVYRSQSNYMYIQAFERDYVPGSYTKASVIVDLMNREWLGLGGKVLQAIPSGTELLAFAGYKPVLIRAIRNVPVDEIASDTIATGSSDANFTYIANWAVLRTAGYRFKGARTVEIDAIVRSEIGSRAFAFEDFQKGASADYLVAMLSKLDEAAHPVWHGLKHYSTSGYIDANLNHSSPGANTWILDYSANLPSFLTGLFALLTAQLAVTKTQLSTYRDEMPTKLLTAFPDADPATLPTLGLYEYGMHITFADFPDAGAAETAMRAIMTDARMYAIAYDLETFIRGLGLSFAVGFADYERPKQQQAFGRLWKTGDDYADKQQYLAMRAALDKPVESE